MFIRYYKIFLCIFIVGLSGCTLYQPVLTYKNNDLGISFDYPSSWIVDESEGNQTTIIINTNKEQTNEKIYIEVAPEEKWASFQLTDILQTYEEQWASQIPYVSSTEVKQAVVNNRQIASNEGTVTLPHQLGFEAIFHYKNYVIKEGNKIVVVISTSLDKENNVKQEEFKIFWDSLEIQQ